MNTFLSIFVFIAEAGAAPYNFGICGFSFALLGIIGIYFGIGSGKESARDNLMLTIGLVSLIFGMLFIISALIHGAKNEILEEIRKTNTPAERPVTPKQC